jgi:pyridoxine 5-phosphate synthase
LKWRQCLKWSALHSSTKPDLVTLVPERREELTTEGGLDVKSNPEHYRKVIRQLKEKGIHVSLFIDPDPEQIEIGHRIGADVVEIHTGHYAEAKTEAEILKQFDRISRAADQAFNLELGLSAGHGLNYVNIKRFKTIAKSKSTASGTASWAGPFMWDSNRL